MADKDLVYFQQGIPAGHQTDKYSTNPGCLFSKNADIFSSSNSYRATAWSTPGSQGADILFTDDKERIVLKNNWDVVDTSTTPGTTIFNVSTSFTNINGGVQVDYIGPDYPSGTNYSALQLGTAQKLLVKYNGDEWQEIVVYTDTIMFVKSRTKSDIKISEVKGSNCTATIESDGGRIRLSSIKNKDFWVVMNFESPGFSVSDLGVMYDNRNGSTGTLGWRSYNPAQYLAPYMYYDAKSESMVMRDLINQRTIPDLPVLTDQNFSYFDTTIYKQTGITTTESSQARSIELYFTLDTTDTVSSSTPRGGVVDIDGPRRVDEYYYVLPKVEDRIIKDIGEYYFVYNHGVFPSLYQFSSEWVERYVDGHERTVPLYTFEQYMGWEIGPDMTCVDCVVFDEKVYLICNKDGNGYIVPCSLSGEKGTPYIAYGVEFKAAIVLNYLIYLVGENRGISTLFIYSGTELVHVIEGNKKNGLWEDRIDCFEQFKFNGMMADRRGRLVLGTEDNRVFCYGQTYGGRGGAFIHSLGSGQTLTNIRTKGKDLYVEYTENGVKNTIKYQDDSKVKNYNTEFEVVYPIVLGNHLVEKEVYDLTVSYILPSSSCKLEFWVMANQYTFWTFKLATNVTLDSDTHYMANFLGGSYWFKFIEKNGMYYTFELVGNVPYQYVYGGDVLTQPIYIRNGGIVTQVPNQSTRDFIYYGDTWVADFTEFNHFKKIGEVSDGYKEGYFRSYNINNKLGLPRTHSIQLKIKGTGNGNYTPEVFSVDLVSNQRERG